LRLALGIKTLQYKGFRAESVAQKFGHLTFPKKGSKKGQKKVAQGNLARGLGEAKGLGHLRKGSWQGWQSDEQLRKALGIKTL